MGGNGAKKYYSAAKRLRATYPLWNELVTRGSASDTSNSLSSSVSPPSFFSREPPSRIPSDCYKNRDTLRISKRARGMAVHPPPLLSRKLERFRPGNKNNFPDSKSKLQFVQNSLLSLSLWFFENRCKRRVVNSRRRFRL